MLIQGLEVGREQDRAVGTGDTVQEALLGIEIREHEQHQGRQSTVVPVGPAAVEVPAVVPQAGADPPGRSRPALELQEIEAPLTTVPQLE